MDNEVIGYEGDDPTKTQIGDNPNHKMLMAWKVPGAGGTHTIQYHHGSMGFGTSPHNFTMHDANDKFVGTMGLYHDGLIQHLEIHPELRRQGLATKLYNFGHELHGDIPSIPAPKHSSSRTASGDAWAKAVGGEVPPRGPEIGDQDYRSNRWPTLRDPTVAAVKSHLNEFHAKMLTHNFDKPTLSEVNFQVRSAQDYLNQANKVGKDHENFYDHMSNAHDHIDELGQIHDSWGGDMSDHQRLNEHIRSVY